MSDTDEGIDYERLAAEMLRQQQQNADLATDQAAHDRMDAARQGASSTSSAPADARHQLEEAMQAGGMDGLMAAAQRMGYPTSWDA